MLDLVPLFSGKIYEKRLEDVSVTAKIFFCMQKGNEYIFYHEDYYYQHCNESLLDIEVEKLNEKLKNLLNKVRRLDMKPCQKDQKIIECIQTKSSDSKTILTFFTNSNRNISTFIDNIKYYTKV